MSTICVWVQDDEGSDTWWPSCRHRFTFTEGGPTQNGFRYCCYCGKPIAEAPWEQPEEDKHE